MRLLVASSPCLRVHSIRSLLLLCILDRVRWDDCRKNEISGVLAESKQFSLTIGASHDCR